MNPPDERRLTRIPPIDLGDLLLRPVQYSDYRDMYDYGSDPEVTRHLSWDAYTTIEQARQSVRHVFLTRPFRGVPAAYAIVHKADDKMIGTCDVFTVDWDHGVGEIGYVLHRSYWGRGYMTRTLRAVIVFAFEYLGLLQIDIRHHPDNIGSRRVIEKCGFTPVGTAYYKGFDMRIPVYRMTKQDWIQAND